MSEYNIRYLFERVIENEASDLLLTVGIPPLMRVDEDLRELGDEQLTGEDTRRLIYGLLNEKQRERFGLNKELDLSVSTGTGYRFRVNVYMQKGNIAAAFRVVPHRIPTLDELGAPAVVKKLALRRQGLILVTGATGQGKSTTQAAMLDLINSTRRCHIVTIEDPIEFIHEHKLSAIDQREVGADTKDFKTALRNALRQDPDVLFVGEMRDLETISTTLTAAETGHLVITTLHTNDAVQSIDRIVDVYPSHQQKQIRTQLAFSLLGIVAQQLIPRSDGKGRVLAAETLLNNVAIANVIREGKTHTADTIMQTHRAVGMMTMDESIVRLYKAGLITLEEAKRRVKHPSSLSSKRNEEGYSFSDSEEY